ncbi:MAG: ABC transporter permease [Isosphaeraceae bacterium]
MVPPRDLPTVQIRANSGRSPVNLGEIARHHELLWTLADRDIRVRYKQTALGVVWVVLQPLMGSLIFAFVFGVVAQLSVEGLPYTVFAFAGLMAWNTFASIVTRVSHSLLGNAPMVSKIYFPRLILPLSSTASTLVDFAVSLAMMIAMLAIFRINPGWGILLLPVWIAILLTLAMGIGLAAGALMVRYRDVGIIIPVALQMGMYISPVAWSTMVVPEKYRWVSWSTLLGSRPAFVRWSLLGVGTSLSPGQLAYSALAAAAGLLGRRRVQAAGAQLRRCHLTSRRSPSAAWASPTGSRTPPPGRRTSARRSSAGSEPRSAAAGRPRKRSGPCKMPRLISCRAT